MNFLPIRLGSILDLRAGTQWDKETLRYETRLRSALLQNLEIGPGDVVGVFHGNSLEFFADLFAVWQVGATAACLNENLTAPELANVCDFLSAKLLLTDLKQAPEIEATVPVVCTRERLDELLGNPEGVNGPASLDQPALILFTSGTTSLPKGVVHTFRSLLARTALNRQRIGDEALRRTLCVLPTHFGHGLIGNCLTPLFAGGELCLYPSIRPHEYGDLAEILSEARISFMSSVPTMWKLSLKLSKEPRVNHLQCVHVGSAPLSADLWQDIIRWTDTECVVNAYGITETANWTAGISAAEMVPEDGLVGRMWGGNAAVIKANGETKDTGEGELLLHSPSLMSGYFNIPVLTDEVLISGWYRTGDNGSIDKDGIIRLTGRRKSEINRAGAKIQPEELDLLLERHPCVEEACAFGIADEIAGELVGMALVVSGDATAESTQFLDWCRERIKPDNVPERWFFLPEIPKNDRGKVNREHVSRVCTGGEAK